MARRRWGTKRGAETYARALDVGRVALQRGGLGALSMRRLAEATELSRGAVQFHFETHNEFVRAAIRAWAAKISELLDKAAGDARGLQRTWKLCEQWMRLPDQVDVVLESLVVEAPTTLHQVAREAALTSMRHWVDETRRSLRHAQVKHELKPGVDIRAVAVEIHQLLWGRGWTSALYGVETAAAEILRAAWHRLSAIAVDPCVALPPQSEIVAPPAAEAAEAQEEIEDATTYEWDATWKLLLERTDPLYHAFRRHADMGDRRTFISPPAVTDEDIAEAEKVKAKTAQRQRHGSERR